MMMNPYSLLTPELLHAMLKQPMYFVRQYYARGCGPYDDPTVPLLLTHYIHHEVDHERSQRHMRLLLTDAYRYRYNSADPADLAKLERAASQPAGYRVYINLLPKKWKPGEGLKRKISQFMLHRLPGWKYSPADKLKVTLKDRYGELYLALLWKGQQTEVNLVEIENFSLCVTT
jgi:hypothetical protein